jgi:hypothetical protein
MKLWSGLLTALGLLALVGTGCHHTAGVCDCDPWKCTQPLPDAHGMVLAPAVGHGVVTQYPVVPGVGQVYSNPAPTVAPQPRLAPQSITRAAE